MALLDAALAFALTLAALATVATIIMEIVMRLLGSKAYGQLQFVLKLCDYMSKEMDIPAFAEGEKRWENVKTILENPFAWTRIKKTKQPSRAGFLVGLGNAIYSDISLEHFLRRILDIPGTKAALEKSTGDLKKALAELGVKYDEYASAIGARFKDRAKLGSLVVGVFVALLLNVDGLRLFQDYVKNPAVANAAIQELQKTQPSGSTATPDASSTASKSKEDPDVQAKLDELNKKLNWIAKLSLPIGNEYFPYCVSEVGDKKPAAKTPVLVDPLCNKYGVPKNFCDRLALIFSYPEGWAWLLKVLITGLLIGLGAPFWYDVARRIGEVRTAFGGSGSGEQRHRGSDAKEKPKDREDLLDAIVKGAT